MIALPPGLRAWDEAIRYPLRAAPWPYTDEQFAAIRETLPAAGDCEQIHALVLKVARTYARSRSLPSRRHGKTAPREEIEAARAALEGVIKACRRLSPPAIEHLQATTAEPVVGLVASVISHSIGLLKVSGMDDLPPATERRGRDTDRILARLVLGCEDIWSALPGGRPRQGFPRFRAACVAPLDPVHRDEKGWQDIRDRARELRAEAGRKAPNRA